MNWDDIYSYADEALDWLKPALEKAEKIARLARNQADSKRPELTAAELNDLRKTAYDLQNNVDDAGSAADSLWNEVKNL